MKKTLGVIAGVALIALSGQSFAADELKVGKKIYDRALGVGCGGCHNQSQNPQLKKLIKEGKLDRAKFGTTLINGSTNKRMPKAMKSIMELKIVEKSGYTEDQAIDAVYKYLSK